MQGLSGIAAVRSLRYLFGKFHRLKYHSNWSVPPVPSIAYRCADLGHRQTLFRTNPEISSLNLQPEPPVNRQRTFSKSPIWAPSETKLVYRSAASPPIKRLIRRFSFSNLHDKSQPCIQNQLNQIILIIDKCERWLFCQNAIAFPSAVRRFLGACACLFSLSRYWLWRTTQPRKGFARLRHRDLHRNVCLSRFLSLYFFLSHRLQTCIARTPWSKIRWQTVQFDSHDYKYRTPRSQHVKLKLLFKFQFLV